MEDKLLPLGSVVTLIGTNDKIVIIKLYPDNDFTARPAPVISNKGGGIPCHIIPR